MKWYTNPIEKEAREEVKARNRALKLTKGKTRCKDCGLYGCICQLELGEFIE